MSTALKEENFRSAEERMKTAHEEHMAFIERQNRTNSPEEIDENRRLLDGLWRAMVQYEKALLQR